MQDKTTTHIWDKYQNGINHHNSINLYAETERNWNFFIGNQWKGVAFKDKNYVPPMSNIIKPTVKLMYSTVAMQQRTVVFSDMSHNSMNAEIARYLTELAKKEWEKGKIDTLMWQVIKRAAIAGDSYLYLRETRNQDQGLTPDTSPKIEHQIIHNTNIYFADEQNPNINEQEYIIISERLPVAAVKKIAKANGKKPAELELIVSDEDLAQEIGDVHEVDTKEGKCTSLLYFEKTDEGIKYSRSTAQLIYDEGTLPIDIYPIVGMRWEEMIGTARGVSAVKYLVPNQCTINYTLYRREQTIKRTAYPKLVYDVNAVQNVSKLSDVGSSIGVQSLAENPVNSLVTYLTPAPISADAANFQTELMTTTRDLAGAGDAASGSVDPTKASGEAIKAARDQAALPLNEQVSAQIQMIEDLARLWYKMWVGYAVNGLSVPAEDEAGNETMIILDQASLQAIEPEIKIDISPIDPYSVMAEDNNLLSMLSAGQITFEEMVEALPDNTNLPKAKFEEILKKRQELQQLQMQAQAQAMAQMPMEGAMTNEMPIM